MRHCRQNGKRGDVKYLSSVLIPILLLACAALGSDFCTQTSFGECITVHARYTVYRGDGMEVLWPVGTHRLLWAEGGTEKLDSLLENHWDDSVVFGDFVVCPRSKDIAGEMRHVCVREMRNLKVVKRGR